MNGELRQDELVDLMRNKTTNQAQNHSLQEQQKETLAMLMEARLGEIERLQDARDAVRLEILKVKKDGGEDTSAQAGQKFAVANLTFRGCCGIHLANFQSLQAFGHLGSYRLRYDGEDVS